MDKHAKMDRKYQQCPNLGMAGSTMGYHRGGTRTIRLRISLISNLFWMLKCPMLQMIRFNLQLMDGMRWIVWADGRQGSAHFRLLKKYRLPTG